MSSNSNYGSRVFTTSYNYGSADKEYVFSCKGHPFVALVSPNLPTPTSSLVDYDLVRKLGLKLTDIQCRKFHFGGQKMRILGRVSTAVQCVQNGKLGGNFHIKGLVVTDLYQLLDTHCVAGTRMQEKLSHLSAQTTDEDESDESDELNNSLEDNLSPLTSGLPAKFLSSPAPALVTSASSNPSVMSSLSNPAPMQPPPTTIVGSKLHVLDPDDLDSIDYWASVTEDKGRIIFLSLKDGQPRVTNLVDAPGKGGGKLCVGDWSNLEDPVDHEARHIIIADIRKVAPHKVCHTCSYLLSHVCPDFRGHEHCAECCHVISAEEAYNKLGRGHRIFMETLLTLTNSPGKDTFCSTNTTYGLFGPHGSEEARRNERAWITIKREDPELAWALLKNLCGVNDWPDWGPDLVNPDVLTLDDDHTMIIGKWCNNLRRANPKSLCGCGFPHLDFECTNPTHDKGKLHCKICCDIPRHHLHCVFNSL